MMYTRKPLLFFFLIFTSLIAFQAQAAKKGKLTQDGYEESDLTVEQGSAQNFQDLSITYTTQLFDKPVDIAFTPVYETEPGYEGNQGTSTSAEDQTLKKVMVVYDFGKRQKFALNIHQNEDAAPEDDLSNAGELYAATKPFFKHATSKRKTKKPVIISKKDMWIFNAFSPFIMSILEKLIEHQSAQNAYDSPLFWQKSPENSDGQPLFMDTGGERFINLHFFFPDREKCGEDSPESVCLMADQIEIQPRSSKQTVSVTVQHTESHYTEGGTVILSQTQKLNHSYYDFSFSEPQFTAAGEKLFQKRMEIAANFLPKVSESVQQPLTLPEKRSVHTRQNFCDNAPAFSSLGAPVVIIANPVTEGDRESAGMTIHLPLSRVLRTTKTQ